VAKAEPRVRKKALNSGSTLHSPFDPDAGLGHKGLGYSAHVTETCHNEQKPEVITSYMVVPANTSDMEMTVVIVSDLTVKERLPSTFYADAGFVSATSLEEAEKVDIKLQGPMRSTFAEDTIGREAFTYGENGIETCPQGHAFIKETKRRYRKIDGVPYKYFDRQICEECPIRDQCIARGGKANNWEVVDLARLRLRDERLAEQKTSEWKKDYAIRAGAEATMSELSRTHGIKRLRVRRLGRVRMSTVFKVTSCNVKRWLKAVA
jgi:hypothetical protein